MLVMVIAVVSSFLAGLLVCWLMQRIIRLQQFVPKAEFTQLQHELQEQNHAMHHLNQELAIARERLARQQSDFVTMKQDLQKEFQLLADRILESKSQQFQQQQESKLTDLLAPFREQIDSFRRQVDEKFVAEVADRNALKGELKKMLELNATLSRQTENLTTALSSQSKTQGDFGELILENMLQHAGMVEGVHYQKQANYVQDSGHRIRPDIVLHMPDGYDLVIDAKVSLSHYIRYCQQGLAADEEKALRQAVWQSYKNHIDSLSGKNYERVPRSVDFVLLFTPVEAALTLACTHDANLRHYAYQRKVFLVTPSNLLIVVKMIGDLWQKHKVSKEAEEMANRALMMHEKLCGLMQSFEQVGAQIDRAKASWETAQKQISGKGGLLTQGKKLEALLGNAPVKRLPESNAETDD